MGTRYEGTDRERRALNTFIRMMRAADTVGQELSRELLARHRLTLSQLGVLEALLHLGPLCAGELSRRILRSPGNLTTVLTNLETRSLVRRVRSEHDRRFVLVELTDTGQELISGLFPAHVASIVELLDSLDPDEQEQLGALCRKLGLGIRERGRQGAVD
jgi:MarR family 2-MHQ and catechol resistance regulon transcriptional repressor